MFSLFFFFFFNDTATTEIYTLSLHDALPISCDNSSPIERETRRTAAETRKTTSQAFILKLIRPQVTINVASRQYVLFKNFYDSR